MSYNVYDLNDIKRAVKRSDNSIKLMWVKQPKRLCLIQLQAPSNIGDQVATYNNAHVSIRHRTNDTKHILGKMVWYIDNPQALKEICN